jgi:hypothetical protein
LPDAQFQALGEGDAVALFEETRCGCLAHGSHFLLKNASLSTALSSKFSLRR